MPGLHTAPARRETLLRYGKITLAAVLCMAAADALRTVLFWFLL